MLSIKELYIYASQVVFVFSLHNRIFNISPLNGEAICGEKYNFEMSMREIPILIDSFRKCFNKCKKEKDLYKMNKLLDKMLHIQPLLRDSYYVGEIDYEEVKIFNKLVKLVELYMTKLSEEERSKRFSRNRRSFQNISDKRLQSSNTGIIPLILAAQDAEKVEACGALLGLDNYEDIVNKNETLFIPMPIISNSTSEKVIKMPTLQNYSVTLNGDVDPSNILVDYYILSMRCLTLTRKQRHAAYLFNVQFLKWILENILPSLSEDELRPAFGGIMKILATMKSIGTLREEKLNTSNKTYSSLKYNKAPVLLQTIDGILKDLPHSQSDMVDNGNTKKLHFVHCSCSCKTLLNTVVYIIAIAWTVMALVILCYCFKMKKGKKRKGEDNDDLQPALQKDSGCKLNENNLNNHLTIGQMAERLETLASRMHTLIESEMLTENELNEAEHRLRNYRCGAGDGKGKPLHK